MTKQGIFLLLSVITSNVLVYFWWTTKNRFVNKIKSCLSLNTWIFMGLFILVSCFLWVGLFVVYKFPISGDVFLFYSPQGEMALDGSVPIRDFPTSYMPGFVYLLGFLNAWFSGLYEIPLFFLFCFCACAWLLISIQIPMSNNNDWVSGIVVGFFNGAIWLYSIGYQQDEIFILFLLLAVVLVYKRTLSAYTIGMSMVIHVFLSKILMGLSLVSVFFSIRAKRQYLLGLISAAFLVLLLFQTMGISLSDLLVSGEMSAFAPPSLPNILGLIHPALNLFFEQSITYFIFVLILCLLSVILYQRLHPTSISNSSNKFDEVFNLLRSVMLVWAIFLILSPKSLPAYRILYVPLLPVILSSYFTSKARKLLFCFYATVLGIQAYFYEHWVSQRYISYLAEYLNDPEGMLRFAFLVFVDIMIIFCEMVWIINLIGFRQNIRNESMV